jgi:acyl carrier protein phosphodiesterase
MNYLAHSLLSYDTPQLTVGNFIADMISNKLVPDLPLGYRNGITLHRHIDHYTDSHPIVRASTALIRDRQRKYAPVVVDMLYDYILAMNWARVTDHPIDRVISSTYSLLTDALPQLPARVQHKVRSMIDDNALLRYTTLPGMHKAFGYLSRRAKFDNGFDMAVRDLLDHYDELENGFLSFFPDLQASCIAVVQQLPSSQ